MVTKNLNRDDLKNKAPYLKGAKFGLSENIIRQISKDKKEPSWMLEKRLSAYKKFLEKPMPAFGPSLKKLDLDKIIYYAKPGKVHNEKDWEDVPEEIKNTFDKLGIPEAEKKALAGAGAQYESSVVYHNLKEQWEKQGVIFIDMDEAVHKYPKIVKEYFMTRCVSLSEHKFAALHAAVWSGGTFLYIPKNVKIDLPLQAYFRINGRGIGQFEHTLIIVDEGAEAHYIEGCSAPRYDVDSLHAGCVEIFVKPGARFRYSSVENWSKSVYNLNTKRAIVEDDATMEWVSGNLGSAVTMLYPMSILQGKNSKADHLSIAFAGEDQVLDTGSKVTHLGANTTSKIVMKSLSQDGGHSIYRGSLKILPTAKNAKTHVQCDALILDDHSKSDTIPDIDIKQNKATIGHEATTGKIDEEKIFYLQSRGLSEEEATNLIVNGFIEPIVKKLPLEYAVEINKLIQMEMEGSVG
ncbi:MAG: Fe-S cluster assembly protein SufB [bacterium]